MNCQQAISDLICQFQICFGVSSKQKLLQRRDVILPRDREMVGQIHSIKRRVLPSGKVSFDAERTSRGHADRFWAIALACQKERGNTPMTGTEIGMRVIG